MVLIDLIDGLILKGAKYDRRMCMLTLYVCLWLMDVNDGQCRYYDGCCYMLWF